MRQSLLHKIGTTESFEGVIRTNEYLICLRKHVHSKIRDGLLHYSPVIVSLPSPFTSHTFDFLSETPQ